MGWLSTLAGDRHHGMGAEQAAQRGVHGAEEHKPKHGALDCHIRLSVGLCWQELALYRAAQQVPVWLGEALAAAGLR